MSEELDPDADEHDLSAREGYDDLRNLFAGVEFLRYLEGEKHIIFVSEQGLSLPGRRPSSATGTLYGREAQEQYDDFASLASDARVTISVVQTGGLQARFTRTGAYRGPTFARMHANQDNRALAELTGGQAFLYQAGETAVDRLDRATRFQYLLGYYPSDAAWDGSFRRIRVAVDRPGVTVQYRHGYFANDKLVPYDRREFLSQTRIVAAATDSRGVRDIRVSVGEPAVTTANDGARLTVDIQIDPRRIAFDTEDDIHTAALHIAVFVGDNDRELLGERWETLDLRLDQATFSRIERENFVHRVTVDIAGAPRYIKAVVDDYRGDRLGTAEQQVRQ